MRTLMIFFKTISNFTEKKSKKFKFLKYVFGKGGGLIFNKMYNPTGSWTSGFKRCFIHEGGKVHAIFTRVGRNMLYSRGVEDSCYNHEGGKVHAIFTRVRRYMLYSRGWEDSCYIHEGGKVHAIFKRVGRFMIYSRGWEDSYYFQEVGKVHDIFKR